LLLLRLSLNVTSKPSPSRTIRLTSQMWVNSSSESTSPVGLVVAFAQILLVDVQAEGCTPAFTFTPLLELPHQAAEHDGHDADEH
jgi:hypothetical protein